MGYSYGQEQKELALSTPNVPHKYWTDSGEVDPITGEPIYVNNWILMEGPKPQDGKEYTAGADGVWECLNDLKLDAYGDVFEDIDTMNRSKNLELFPYTKAGDGEGEHLYVADLSSIQGVQNNCNGMIAAGEAVLTDNIPVGVGTQLEGYWKTDEVNEQMEPIMVHYIISEFLAFANAFFMRSSNNFSVKEMHKANVRALYLDPEATEQDILEYDYSQGWF